MLGCIISLRSSQTGESAPARELQGDERNMQEPIIATTKIAIAWIRGEDHTKEVQRVPKTRGAGTTTSAAGSCALSALITGPSGDGQEVVGGAVGALWR